MGVDPKIKMLLCAGLLSSTTWMNIELTLLTLSTAYTTWGVAGKKKEMFVCCTSECLGRMDVIQRYCLSDSVNPNPSGDVLLLCGHWILCYMRVELGVGLVVLWGIQTIWSFAVGYDDGCSLFLPFLWSWCLGSRLLTEQRARNVKQSRELGMRSIVASRVKKGSGRHPTFQGWERSVFNQTNIGTVSRATFGETAERRGRSAYRPCRALRCHLELKLKLKLSSGYSLINDPISHHRRTLWYPIVPGHLNPAMMGRERNWPSCADHPASDLEDARRGLLVKGGRVQRMTPYQRFHTGRMTWRRTWSCKQYRWGSAMMINWR